MKVIDLLNKIANEEEVPKKIYYGKLIYEWTGLNYYNVINDEFLENHIALEDLNYPVEIIEEEKKIPEKLEEYIHTDSLNYNQCNYMFETLTNKYNQIIDYLKSKEK